MDPVLVAAPLAKAILSQMGKELGGAAARDIKVRILGDPEQKALERALRRAFVEVEKTHGRRLADFDINAEFWMHEGASELSKVLIPGVVPSAVRLAERAVDSLGPSRSDDERRDRIITLQSVFAAMLDELAHQARSESMLQALLGRSDAAQTARAATRIVAALGSGAATEDDRLRYLSWVVDQHRYLRTGGVVRNTTVQLPLDEVFVGLRAQPDQHPGDRARVWFEQEREKLAALVEAGRLDPTSFEAELDRLQTQYGREFASAVAGAESSVAVLEAARDAAQFLVLGDPGTGKTTLLHYLALSHARALLAETPVQGRAARLPIYVRIGEYARQGYPHAGISDFLPRYLSRLECRLPGLADLLGRQLEAGRCLVLLDGLDEIVSAESRRAVVTAVVDFVTAYARQGNRFVVTSRIAGYRAAPLPEPFRAVRMQDMDEDTITAFLEVYCRQVERAETPNNTDAAIRDAGAREAAAIAQALKASAGVRRLAANPLLLTALVLVHRSSGRLPHRRADAYAQVCHALGRTWRRAQGIAETDLPDERILTRWLTELGAWMHQYRPEGAVSKRELLEVLGPLWAAHQGHAWDPHVLAAADPLGTEAGRGVVEFVEKADMHTGLLVERAPGRYGFAHLTFEEYYAGRALAFRGTATHRIMELRRRLHDPRYEEPILLALGLIGTDYAEQIDDVVTQAIYPAAEPSPYEDLLGRDFLFALRVLADDPPMQTAIVDTLINQAIEEWLTRDVSRCRFASYRQALQQRLAALSGTQAAQRFRIALDDHAVHLSPETQMSWTQLAGVAARLGPLRTATAPGRLCALPTTTVEVLVQIATGKANTEVRVEAGWALAASGVLNERVTAALVRIATNDLNANLRASAVSSLAAGAVLSPDVIAALVSIATGDADSDVRVQASSVLATGAVLTDEVIAALVRIATGDADSDVRVQARAVTVLAAGGVLSDDVTAALVRVATGDAASSAQSRAVTVLAAGGVLSDDVTAALIRVATGVADPDVRVEAAAVLAAGGMLSDDTTTALIQITTGDAAPYVRARAGSVLAAGGMLNEDVTAALVQIGTGDADSYVRVKAVSALAAGGALSGPVTVALLQLATGDASPRVRARAISTLASGGMLGDDVISTLAQVAVHDADPDVRTRAGSALATAGRLSESVTAILVQTATGDATPRVRARAVTALADGASVDEPMAAVLVEIATGNDSWTTRREAVKALRKAQPTEELRKVLVSLFKDRDNDIRREAAKALTELSARHPRYAADIETDLARACNDPSLAGKDTVGPRTGWDYAYEALQEATGEPHHQIVVG